jgi:P-type conjugative transfer protein TrbJ
MVHHTPLDPHCNCLRGIRNAGIRHFRCRRRRLRSHYVRQSAAAARTRNGHSAQQLQYVIKNTTGGGAGAWSSNAGLLNNLGDIINQQEGLSYTIQGLSTQFQQYYAGYAVSSMVGVQSPLASGETTLNTLNGTLASAQAQAQNFGLEQASLGNLELKNQTAVGNLQAVQVSNELALAQVQQMQMLRQLVMAQTNAQNVVAASQVNDQQQQQRLEAMALIGAPPTGDTALALQPSGPLPRQ